MKRIYRSAILNIIHDNLDETVRYLGDYLPRLVTTELITGHRINITLEFVVDELTIEIEVPQ